MSSPILTAVEARILGCLLEKERLVPENYPLSPNSLMAACNQSTNRDPVVSYNERTVDDGVTSLREKKLAILIHTAGARVQKYKHNLPDQYELSEAETALLCVLLLRGPQTPGELRARTERLFAFNSIEHLEHCLDDLCRGQNPIVKLLPARPGQKERRYVQLLSEEPAPSAAEFTSATSVSTATSPARAAADERFEQLQSKVAALEAELQTLREEFTSFRKQFE